MIKIILTVMLSVFLTISLVLILYWRDAAYAPNRSDLITYFILLPLAISLLLLSPYLLRKWYKQRQTRNNQVNPMGQATAQVSETAAQNPTTWLQFQVFSAAAYSAFGENTEVLQGMMKLTGPELDSKLLNGLDQPILSYRILDLDRLLDNDQQEEDVFKQRIHLLLQQQLEQHTETLYAIVQQLKKSAQFYNMPISQQYQIHPEWIDPARSVDAIEQQTIITPVFRLEHLNIHIVLSEYVLHHWDEYETTTQIQLFLQALEILPEHTQFHYHYLAQHNAYTDWVAQLKIIAQQADQLSLILMADSEIDQNLLDEKIWVNANYIPAEFASSCCIASTDIQIEHLSAIQWMHLVLDQDQLLKSLETLDITALEQYQSAEPFVFILDDPTNIKGMKTTMQHFMETPIEAQHFIYTQPSLGHSLNLSKVFGCMLAMQFKVPACSMVYSAEQPTTQWFMTAENIKMNSMSN